MLIYLGRPDQKTARYIHDNYGPLCFTATEDSTVALVMSDNSSITASLQISYGNNVWETFNGLGWDGHVLEVKTGQKLFIKALNDNTNGFYNNDVYHKFVLTGELAASGNIQYLLTTDGKRTDVPSYCYSQMFQDCSNLSSAPALPATTLADRCYSQMFQDCSNLSSAPALPATTLAKYCYANMLTKTKVTSVQMKKTELMITPYDSNTHGTLKDGLNPSFVLD